jgi:perosamine synthetase
VALAVSLTKVNLNMISHSRPWINAADLCEVQGILQAGMIAAGAKVSELEAATGRYVGVGTAVAQASGTAALVLALNAIGMSCNDEVIIPTYVCRSVLDAVLTAGAIPVLCDVDEYGVVTAESVAPHIGKRTRAIIAVHIFGHPCDVMGLKSFGIPIVEDACQALGLLVGHRMAGSLGDVGVLSFHATKCLTTGEGGMLVTSSETISARAREIVTGTLPPGKRCVAPISDLQAALGLSQLARYEDFLSRREVIRAAYTDAALAMGIRLGFPSDASMLFRFTVRTERQFELVAKKFSGLGIQVRRGVDELLHRYFGVDDKAFPVAVRIFNGTVSLPFYPSLDKEQIGRICESFGAIRDVN